MALHCEHCQTLLPAASLFCQDCSVVFCSACCQDNHSAPGEDGSFRFHRISEWSEKVQKDAACLVVNHLVCQIEQVKRDGEAEIAQCGQRIDRLKELLQDQMRLQLGNRLSSLEESVTRIRRRFSVNGVEEDCFDDNDANRSSRPIRADKAEFLLGKSKALGILTDTPPETHETAVAIKEFLDLVDDACSAADPFSRLPRSAVQREDDNTSFGTLSTSGGTEDFDDGLQHDDNVAPSEQSCDDLLAEADEELFKSASQLSLSVNSQENASSSTLSAAQPPRVVPQAMEAAAFNSIAKLSLADGRPVADVLDACVAKAVAFCSPELSNTPRAQVVVYQFCPSGNEFLPVKATVLIRDMPLACGYGLTEPQARYEAARKILAALAPGIEELPRERHEDHFFSVSPDIVCFLQKIPISAPYYSTLLPEQEQQFALSIKPQRLLTEFLRDYVARTGDVGMEQRVTDLSATSHLYYLKVAGVEAAIPCADLVEGKNLAIQAILSKLHPAAQTWAELVQRFFTRQPDLRDVRHEPRLSTAISGVGGVVGKSAVGTRVAPEDTPTSARIALRQSTSAVAIDPTISIGQCADKVALPAEAAKTMRLHECMANPPEHGRLVPKTEEEEEDVVFVEQVIVNKPSQRNPSSDSRDFGPESLPTSSVKSNKRITGPRAPGSSDSVSEQPEKADSFRFKSIEELLDMFPGNDDDDDIL